MKGTETKQIKEHEKLGPPSPPSEYPSDRPPRQAFSVSLLPALRDAPRQRMAKGQERTRSRQCEAGRVRDCDLHVKATRDVSDDRRQTAASRQKTPSPLPLPLFFPYILCSPCPTPTQGTDAKVCDVKPETTNGISVYSIEPLFQCSIAEGYFLSCQDQEDPSSPSLLPSASSPVRLPPRPGRMNDKEHSFDEIPQCLSVCT